MKSIRWRIGSPNAGGGANILCGGRRVAYTAKSAEVSQADAEENAMRIVSSVNALAGIGLDVIGLLNVAEDMKRAVALFDAVSDAMDELECKGPEFAGIVKKLEAAMGHPNRGRYEVELGDGWQTFSRQLPYADMLGVVMVKNEWGALIRRHVDGVYCRCIHGRMLQLDEFRIKAAIVAAGGSIESEPV